MFISFNLHNDSPSINFGSKQAVKNATKKSVRVSLNKINYDAVDISTVKKMIQSGSSLSQIGKAIGEKISTVRSILKHFGLNTKEGEIVSKIDKNELLNLINKGYSQKQIAKHYGIKNIAALTPLFKQLGIKVTANKVDNISKFELEGLLEAKMTLEKIAEYFKVSPQYITKRFKDLGLSFPRTLTMQRTVAIEELKLAAKQGLTKEEMAKRFEVTPQKISKLMREYGIKTKYELQADIHKEITLDDLKEQLKFCRTKAQIARNLGVSDVYITKLLKLYNLELNPNALPRKEDIIDSLNNICNQVSIKRECVPEFGTKGSYAITYLKNRLCYRYKIDNATLEKLIKKHDLKDIIKTYSKQLEKRINDIIEKSYLASFK